MVMTMGGGSSSLHDDEGGARLRPLSQAFAGRSVFLPLLLN